MEEMEHIFCAHVFVVLFRKIFLHDLRTSFLASSTLFDVLISQFGRHLEHFENNWLD